MKNTIIVIIALTSFCINAQELNHKQIKERIENSVNANFPVQFNSYRSLRNIFYGKCDRYPKHCQKLKFGSITDFRIISVDKVTQENYTVKASLGFSYHAESYDHYGAAILESEIKKVLDGYEIDYIKLIGHKGIREYYEPIREEEYYILNRLSLVD
jgi:hypothetical protein